MEDGGASEFWTPKYVGWARAVCCQLPKGNPYCTMYFMPLNSNLKVIRIGALSLELDSSLRTTARVASWKKNKFTTQNWIATPRAMY